MYGIVYKATNKVNGKVYIGQTTYPLNVRIKEHIKSIRRKKNKYYFHRALKKYGESNFIWKTIARCNSKEELNKVEIVTIKKCKSFGRGYNLSRGGEGNAGFKHSAETKKKLSRIKGEKASFYGKHHTEESKRKISEPQKGEKSFNYGKCGKKSPISKKYLIITPEKDRFFIHGLADFCKNYKKEKLYHSNLIKVANGERYHHKGYKCRRLHEELMNVKNS